LFRKTKCRKRSNLPGKGVAEMMEKASVVLLFLVLAGCAAPRAQISNPMTVSDVDYGLLWRASLEVLSEDFDIPYMNEEEGRIRTAFREGGTIVDPWESDASSFGGLLEESLVKTRRMVALDLKREDGGTTIEAHVFRQRNASLNYPAEHATEPLIFDPRQTDYYPRDINLFPLQEDAYVMRSEAWLPDGRDADFERKLLGKILRMAYGR
jgi:hypothetical protein